MSSVHNVKDVMCFFFKHCGYFCLSIDCLAPPAVGGQQSVEVKEAVSITSPPCWPAGRLSSLSSLCSVPSNQPDAWVSPESEGGEVKLAGCGASLQWFVSFKSSKEKKIQQCSVWSCYPVAKSSLHDFQKSNATQPLGNVVELAANFLQMLFLPSLQGNTRDYIPLSCWRAFNVKHSCSLTVMQWNQSKKVVSDMNL